MSWTNLVTINCAGFQTQCNGHLADDSYADIIAANFFPQVAGYGTGGSIVGSANGRPVLGVMIHDDTDFVVILSGPDVTNNVPTKVTVNGSTSSFDLLIADVASAGVFGGNYYLYWNNLDPAVGSDFFGTATIQLTATDSGGGGTVVVPPGYGQIPDLDGKSNAGAAVALHSAGFKVKQVLVATEVGGAPLNKVLHQDPPAFSVALLGTAVTYTVAKLTDDFDVEVSVISQYANSPSLMALINNMEQYIDPRTDLDNFYNFVWNVDTAQGFGLDVWGRIVGVSRLLNIPANNTTLGFENADIPPDYAPFNQGTWNTGANATQTYLLPDDIYRTLILTKALANIVATTAQSFNQLLRNLFPGRGKCYVVDLGGMAMKFVFEFDITPAEYAILTQSGAMPHPAGVFFSVQVVPSGLFGFSEAGPPAQPFDQGVFYNPP